MGEPTVDRLNYSSVNEDWRTEAEALRLQPDARVLCVTGSGDRPLDLLALAPVRVVAIDRSAPQNHLLELKVAAMQTLEFPDYAGFLGLHPAEPRARAEAYAALAPHLSVAARAFWSTRRRDLEAGVLYQGRFERYFRKVGKLGHALRPRTVDALFELDDLEAQRRFVAEHWDKDLWRFAFRVLASARVSRLFYGDPAFFAHAAVPVGPYLYARIRGYLDRALARDSFMLNLVFRGQLGADLPPYLTAEGCDRIRERLGGLEIVTGDVTEHMRQTLAQTVTHFSLSDVPSYMSRAQLEDLFGAVMRAGKPGARVVVRQFLTRYEITGNLAPYFDREPELEAKLEAEDRSCAYSFIIATTRAQRARSASPTIDELREADEEDALAIERACVQGESLRLRFHRERFRRRAETFDDHLLLAARIDGRLVGTAAVAFKDVVVRGESMRASFYFDLRVHPAYRGQHIARHLGTESFVQGFVRSDIGYYYTVADNRALLHMQGTSGVRDVGEYAYLVLPTYRVFPPATHARAATLAEVHERLLLQAGPFDFYSDPRRGGRLDGHVASFLVERGAHVAGCSVWDNRPILAEVVESLPAALRVAGRVLRTAPFGGHAPHLPEPGEVLRSWYLFDTFASDGETARDLLRHVLAEARARGIDYCYLIHSPSARWVDFVRADFPRAFAPLVRYRLCAAWQRRGRVPRFENVYVDVRDL